MKLIQTSDSQACEILEWEPEEAIILARPRLNAFVETVHSMLEVITSELGAMDPASVR
ncbi:uncharacterized protein METZ01_LOCUS90339 [marine metagenome]|uniref:Uncharacterized protein n=1 Tax=marine metagenome TaxID=408172 RepID=A0A381VAU1_9ZZZZ